MERYNILTAPDERHMALVRRERDGKTATVDVRWLRSDGDAHVPVSRRQALRMECLREWKK